MNEANCEDVLVAWMAESDGERSTVSGEQISSHIKGCGKCRQEVEQILRVDSLLKQQTRHQQDANLWPAVEKRLASRIVPQIGWAPFGLFGAIFVAYKLLEMLPERAPGIAFKLLPLILIISLFVLIRENPFRINAELTLER
jgi:hypothetical protein